MKTRSLKTIAMIALAIFTLTVSATSCSKDGSTPITTPPPVDTTGHTNGGTGTGGNNHGNNPDSTGTTTPPPPPTSHSVDPQLVGTWIWTSSGNSSWYDENGTYTGPASGLALEYKINADGSGTSLSHFLSSIGAGTSMEVNISSQGFYESDNAAHFGYFPLSGTYESTGALGGEDRDLNSTEVYDPSTGSGKYYIYQQLVFGEVNGRRYFEVTASDGTVDRYYKYD